MKWLIGLCAVQTVLLAVIGFRVIAIDIRTDEIADAADAAKLAAQTAAAKSGARAAMPAARVSSTPAASAEGALSDDDALRLAIREELAAWAASGNAAPGSGAVRTADAKSAAQSAPSYDPTQAVIAQSAFDQEFDRYKSRGAINNMEMEKIHETIAQLPPEARRAAMIKLTRAINSGEIQGRF